MNTCFRTVTHSLDPHAQGSDPSLGGGMPWQEVTLRLRRTREQTGEHPTPPAPTAAAVPPSGEGDAGVHAATWSLPREGQRPEQAWEDGSGRAEEGWRLFLWSGL